MNILILGGGGREHAFAWKLSQSPLCQQLYVAPGNAGTAQLAQNLPLDPENFEAVKEAVLRHQIGLVVVGPEAPLVAGIRDFFEQDAQLRPIPLIGPGRLGAQLEGSKDFSKAFMLRHRIPTAAARTFTKDYLQEGLAYLTDEPMPIVLKADGLAAGKGVVICQTEEEARQVLQQMLVEDKFGKAGAKVLVEQFLDGTELSVFVLTDGKDYLILPEAKDYKRIGEGDTGPNTGGMGAVSPVSIADKAFMDKVEEQVVKRTIAGLQQDGIPFQGFLFIGLMKVKGEPFVIEYNVRMGDPETQAVLPRVGNDLAELFLATAQGRLGNQQIHTLPGATATVVMAAGGYPEGYEKGNPISGLGPVQEGALVFHAGTREEEGQVVSNGGRVLAVTGQGPNLQQALERAYAQVNGIRWANSYHRRDIGQDVLA
ncbi:phosphoribosylamine--glycine ligase [Cesiribacter andamanensis]|uniref:Phosphoribosylamine--glycine ligase n=1 Tax=Cesiribacter andamanensis AMV16 TaxID=1279009 RepID=M7NRH7_9BACT|nr:phosphoribosylamine--glycine ligase [Cesiribacter andamanensis]EMR04280.1 Phosphoribosylamine--glycine ligase [Cesiribacter andamanensis AMV16]